MIMNKIIAKGKYHGNKIVVECFIQDGSLIIELNNEFDELVQQDFEHRLESLDPLGGTYYPPSDSLLAALAVLESQFFDDEPEITVEGDIGEIPTYERKDLVY